MKSSYCILLFAEQPMRSRGRELLFSIGQEECIEQGMKIKERIFLPFNWT
jgi:hypothetical protein